MLVILDASDLRKPQSEKIDFFDQVRSLERTPVRGSSHPHGSRHCPNGAGAMLYKTSFSTLTPGFRSKNREYSQAVLAVKNALAQQGARPAQGFTA